jgi:hypothetical protein
MSTIQKNINTFEDYIKKIDQRIRSEDLKNLDGAQKSINDSKALANSCSKLVIILNPSSMR